MRVHLTRMTVRRTTTPTDNKKERLRKRKIFNACIGINYAHRFPKCFKSLHTLMGFSLCTSCRQINQSLYQFVLFLTCTRIPCIVSHCENGLVRCCLHTHTVGYSRPPSAVNEPTATKKRTNRESRTSEV